MANPRRKKRKSKAHAADIQSVGAKAGSIAQAASEKIHSFSRTIAEKHGEKAAVLLQYLAHQVSKSKQVHSDKKWFYKTLDELVVVFPYLKRSTIHDTLLTLKENGVLQIGDFNKKGYDRTSWYAFRDDNVRKQAQSSKPVYFQVEDAKKYGMVAAVLLGNLVHWIRENRKQDPQYKWHPISLGELAKHLPFSKPTMHRALKKLVDAKVISPKTTESKGEVIEYKLVNETRLTQTGEGGSKPDMPGVSNPDESVSFSDMGVSNPDMTISKSDMGVSNPDNNTILIEYPFKDPRLKDPGYVEPSLPNPVTNFPKPDKLKGVKDVHPFAGIVASGTHTPNPMPSKKSSKSSGSLAAPGSSAESSAKAPVATSLPWTPHHPPSSAPGPKKATRVKLSKSLEAQFFKYTQALQEMKPVTAQSAVTLMALDWITLFFRDTKAEQLAEFLKISDQETLYDKLADSFAPHLAKHLERFTNTRERKLLAQFSSQLVMQFLTQAFCRYGDDRYVPVASANSYKVSVMLVQKLRPYWDELENREREKLKAQQAEILKQRAEKYASQDKAKENRADLSAAEKVKVLQSSLASRNNVGAFDDKNHLHHQVIEYNNRTFDGAFEFFQANPDFTVTHLNAVLDKCLPLPKEPAHTQEGNDPLWYARKGKDISFLIQHLDKIAASLNCVDQVAPSQVVPAEQLFRKRSKPG